MKEREIQVQKKSVQRRLKRAREKLEAVMAKEDCLSKHGFWDMGCLRGEISVLEDWLDELNDLLE